MIRMQIQRRDHWVVLPALPPQSCLPWCNRMHDKPVIVHPQLLFPVFVCEGYTDGIQHRNMKSERKKRGSAGRKPVQPEFLKANCNYQLIWLPALEAGAPWSKGRRAEQNTLTIINRREENASCISSIICWWLDFHNPCCYIWVVKRTRITLP